MKANKKGVLRRSIIRALRLCGDLLFLAIFCFLIPTLASAQVSYKRIADARRGTGQLADLFRRLSIASFLAPRADHAGERRQVEDRLGLSIQTTWQAGDIARCC